MIILLTRVYAVYHPNRRLFIILVVLFITEVAHTFTILTVAQPGGGLHAFDDLTGC